MFDTEDTVGGEMIGTCNMKIKSVTIHTITGTAMRSWAASLMKANDNDVFMVFVQKTDANTFVSGDSCLTINVERSIAL